MKTGFIVWCEDSGGRQEVVFGFEKLEDAHKWNNARWGNDALVMQGSELNDDEWNVLLNTSVGYSRHDEGNGVTWATFDAADEAEVLQLGDALGIARIDAMQGLDLDSDDAYDEIEELTQDNEEAWEAYFESVYKRVWHFALTRMSAVMEGRA